MTQDVYQRAMKFAGGKHARQQVPGTEANYLLHLSNVAMEVLLAHAAKPNFDLDFAVQIAILHDTLEDTATDALELENEFGKRVAAAVQALTKDSRLSSKPKRMQDSLYRINQLEREVGIVKLADRITNLQAPPKHWSQEKIAGYRDEARLIVQSLADKNDYLERRLEQKIIAYERFIT